MRALYLCQSIALFAAAAPGQHERVRVTYSDAAFPHADRSEPAPIVLRVVDGRTGAPLAAAEVFAIAEQEHPLPGVLEFAERAVADADGFARLSKGASWIMARADGYGPGIDMDQRDRVFPLMRGLDVPVAVQDWRGQPFAGHLVGWCGGCGHTPDLQNAVTGPDGRATLRCIDPGNGISDLYLACAPIEFDYDDVRWSEGDPPVVHRFGPGAVLAGRVLEPDGSPAADAMVGMPEKHRGPWAATGADGHFVLGGLHAGLELLVVHRGRTVEFLWPAAEPCTFRLPPHGADDPLAAEPRPEGSTAVLRCVLRGAPASMTPPEYSVRGPLPGRWRWSSNGEAAHQLVPGRYEVTMQHPLLFDARAEVDVAAGAVTELPFEHDLLPTTVIAVEALPADGEVALRDAREQRDITAAVRRGEGVPVDPGRDYCVRLEHDGQARLFAVAGHALLHGARPTFRWFLPTRIAARLRDAAGARVAADVALVEHIPCPDVDGAPEPGFDARMLATTPCDGDLSLSTTAERHVHLWVRPRDASLRPRLLCVPMRPRGDEVRVDLGDVVLSPRARLRLRAADGGPVRTGVALLRPGRADLRERCFEVFALADDGSWIGPDLEVGDALMIPADDEAAPGKDGVPTVALPFRIVIAGPEALDQRLPSGRLDLAVHGESGEPMGDCTVLLRECLWAAHGALAITGVPAGPHRLFVTAEGHRTAVVDVELLEGEQRALRIVLPRR